MTRASPAGQAFAKGGALRKGRAGFTLAEVMVAVALLALTSVGITQALLQLNRQAAVSRVMNAAKAEALSRIQQVSQYSYNPDALPPVIPPILEVGERIEPVDLGSKLTDLGSIPGTATWKVAVLSNGSNTRSIECTIKYKYLGKDLSYELFTYKSPD